VANAEESQKEIKALLDSKNVTFKRSAGDLFLLLSTATSAQLPFNCLSAFGSTTLWQLRLTGLWLKKSLFCRR